MVRHAWLMAEVGALLIGFGFLLAVARRPRVRDAMRLRQRVFWIWLPRWMTSALGDSKGRT